MKRGQFLAAAGALIASALIGGTLISSVLAAPVTPAPGGASAMNLSGGGYCEVYLDALSEELGVERAALGAASKAAMNAVIDAAVADGEYDEEEAAEARDRIAELDDTECEAFRPRVGRHGGHGAGVLRGAADAASGALGMEQHELVAAFRDGTTLQELAESQGVAYETVTAAVTNAVRAELDEAVADEEISQERADRVLDRLGEWLADGGEPMRLGPRGGGPFGG